MTIDAAPPTGAGDRFARQLRGFGPIGILALLVILLTGSVPITRYAYAPLGAALALIWARWSRTPWADLGFAAPRSWLVTILIGLLLGAALKVAMKAVVMPLLGADPVNRAFHFLAGNRAAIPEFLFTVIVSAGFGEEVVFRGFLFERLGRLIGARRWAKPAIVVVTAALFGVAHAAQQSLPGVEQGLVVGLVFGTLRAITGRIWMLIVAHAAFDLTAYAMIYWNAETRIAHLVFK